MMRKILLALVLVLGLGATANADIYVYQYYFGNGYAPKNTHPHTAYVYPTPFSVRPVQINIYKVPQYNPRTVHRVPNYRLNIEAQLKVR